VHICFFENDKDTVKTDLHVHVCKERLDICC